MELPARSIRLELWFDGDSPTGRASTGAGEPRRFAGWLGLMAAVEALRGEPGAPEEFGTSVNEEDGNG